MADQAVQLQLPFRMVTRKGPATAVTWPALATTNLHPKDIEGDGNCLFSSLSDQLYQTTSKNDEIRQRVVEYMRENPKLFRPICLTDDLEQRRATRGRGVKKIEDGDPFEEYLQNMSTDRVYGGEPEVLAFCGAYHATVKVFLPVEYSDNQGPPVSEYSDLLTTETDQPAKNVAIVYSGIKTKHYSSTQPNFDRLPATDERSSNVLANTAKIDKHSSDSHRSFKNGANAAEPHEHSSDSRRSSIASTGRLSKHSSDSRPFSKMVAKTTTTRDFSPERLAIRAIRAHHPTLKTPDITEFLKKGQQDLENGFRELVRRDRARSSSLASSHRSSSSKRSLEDGDEPERDVKKADRRKSSKKVTRRHISPESQGSEISFHIVIESSLDPASKASPSADEGDEFVVVEKPDEKAVTLASEEVKDDK